MPRKIAVLAMLLVLAVSGCGVGSGGTATDDPSAADDPIATASVTPGQAIWVAVLATGDTADELDADLAAARRAVGDYLADRVVVKEASCYEGLPRKMDGTFVVAIQDSPEHGVHAMYEEITDTPPFYGPATLIC